MRARASRRGEIVVAMPAKHVWGRKETKPDFIQIDVTGLTLPEMAETRLACMVRPVMVRNLETGKLDFKCRRRFQIRKSLIRSMIEKDRWSRRVTEAELWDMLELMDNDGKRMRDATADDINGKIAEIAGGSETI